jgi:predicted nucleotidyltransferase component of viral defense system
MIPFQEIHNLSKGLPLEIIERDYCLTWLLLGISKSSLQKDIIFYGGTALKKIYFPNFRFSEDLDFLSEKDLAIKNILANFNVIYDLLREKVNINFNTRKETVAFKENRLQFFVEYDGFPEISITKQIKLDMLLKQKPIEEVFSNGIISIYSDKNEIKGILPAYSLEAIAAEKLSAIFDLTRKEPRDIYDLDYLLKQPELNRKKIMARLKRKLGFIPPLSSLLSNIKSDVYCQRWEMRLSNQVVKLENQVKIMKSLEEGLKRLYPI